MAESARLPVDRLLAGYLLLTAPAFAFPHRPDGWPVLLLGHVALAALLLSPLPARLRSRLADHDEDGGPGARATLRRTAVAVLEWYPLLLMPVLYWELPLLSGAVWGGRYFDGVVLAWEEALFGYQPAASLARTWDVLPLSELLHLAYLAYYPVIYVLPAVLYGSGRTDAFRRTVFALMLGFTVHYLLFTVFPVQGPRYLFPVPDGDISSGPLYRLTHTILEAGSSRGAAFPSSHAGLAAVQTVNAFRFLPRGAPYLAAITAGIAVGAVYGGFHYGVDMIAGLAAGVLLGVVAPAAWRALR